MNYAIMVKLGDDWRYMCEGPIDDLRVSVMSLEDAEEAAVEAWKYYGNEQDIKIVPYD